jgi:hypothetical protein
MVQARALHRAAPRCRRQRRLDGLWLRRGTPCQADTRLRSLWPAAGPPSFCPPPGPTQHSPAIGRRRRRERSLAAHHNTAAEFPTAPPITVRSMIFPIRYNFFHTLPYALWHACRCGSCEDVGARCRPRSMRPCTSRLGSRPVGAREPRAKAHRGRCTLVHPVLSVLAHQARVDDRDATIARALISSPERGSPYGFRSPSTRRRSATGTDTSISSAMEP